MKILYVYENISSSLANSGHNIHNQRTIQALEKRGHEIIFPKKSVEAGAHLKKERSIYEKIKARIPNKIGETIRNTYDIIFDRYKYKKYIDESVEKEHPDFIYERMTYFHSAACRSSKKYALPHIIEIHTPISIIPVARWKKIARCIYLENANSVDAIIVISSALKNDLIKNKINREKIHVIPNGADEEMPKQKNVDQVRNIKEKYKLKSKVTIGFIGSMAPYHGVDFLLESLEKINTEIKNFKCILVGYFSYEGEKNKILKILNNGNLKEKIVFIGDIPNRDIVNYIEAMDICVLPSKNNWYGSPLKLFEYGIMGKAILSSKQEPIIEIMEDGKNIMFFEAGNKDDFIDKIKLMINDPNLREKLGNEAQKKVLKSHTWKKNAERIENIYGKIAKEKYIEK